MDIKTQWIVVSNWMRARFGQTERCATLVEYALLVALIAVVCIAAVSLLGRSASTKFNSISASLN
jgi:pilus assembly protein Flp/PilA